jgi:hypothetical protein
MYWTIIIIETEKTFEIGETWNINKVMFYKLYIR